MPEDMTGAGAAVSPGRWNKDGARVIYASKTISLAVLETAAHINDAGLPLNKYVVSIDVPRDVWAARKTLPVSALPGGWDAIPHGMASIVTGSEWYDGCRDALIELPSVIVPEEKIVLINALHPDAARMTAAVTRKLQYNSLFRRMPGP